MKPTRTHKFHGRTFIPTVHPFLDANGLSPTYRWQEQTGKPYPPRFRTLGEAKRWANEEANKEARAYIIELHDEELAQSRRVITAMRTGGIRTPEELGKVIRGAR